MNVRRGEVYFANLEDSTSGSEQCGSRPVLILQNNIGNKYSPTVIVATVTSQVHKKNIPTHLLLDVNGKRNTVLLEQVKTISKERLCQKIYTLSSKERKELDYRLKISLGLDSGGGVA